MGKYPKNKKSNPTAMWGQRQLRNPTQGQMPRYYSEKRNCSGMEWVENTFMIALGGVFESHSKSGAKKPTTSVPPKIKSTIRNKTGD